MTITSVHNNKSQLLDSIALRASSPLERLPHETKGKLQVDEQGGHESLQRLYHIVQATDREKQERFLAHLGLDEHHMITALSLPSSAEQVTVSSWITLLDRILAEGTLNLSQDSLNDRSFFPDAPIPFEELFLPFIHYARQQIQSQLPEYTSLLSLRAQIQLEHHLLKRLSALAEESLWLEYVSFLALRDEVSILDERQPQRVFYDQFLSQYLGEAFLNFFATYSLLARLLIQVMEQWIETGAEFLGRLKADNDLIAHTFFADHALVCVDDIQTECSDFHYHGRTVFLLTFADDHKLVYKPRCMAIDEGFFRCIEWCNERGLSPDLRPVRVLSRDTYGWMEYISHASCATFAEVCAYYRRCGLLLCLFYVLGSTDMHYENLIAYGAYPTPIDLETLLTPVFRNPFSSHSSVGQKVKFSVKRSGMLVMKERSEKGEINTSALADVQMVPLFKSGPVWSNINTDTMMLSHEHGNTHLYAGNRVVLDGKSVQSSDYVEDLVAGFRDMYHFLIEHRAEILADGSMLSFFVGCPIRYVYRPTSVYARQLLRLRNVDFLQDGTRSWIDSQIFKRVLLKDARMDHRYWSIMSCELVSMARRDVPRFSAHTDGTYIYSDDGIFINDVLQESAMEQTRSYIAGLCDEDLEQQVCLIYENILPDRAR